MNELLKNLEHVTDQLFDYIYTEIEDDEVLQALESLAVNVANEQEKITDVIKKLQNLINGTEQENQSDGK